MVDLAKPGPRGVPWSGSTLRAWHLDEASAGVVARLRSAASGQGALPVGAVFDLFQQLGPFVLNPLKVRPN